jgi:hypothetical protein
MASSRFSYFIEISRHFMSLGYAGPVLVIMARSWWLYREPKSKFYNRYSRRKLSCSISDEVSVAGCMTMNKLWRNDRPLLAEDTGDPPREREPARSHYAAEDLDLNYLSPEEVHAWPAYTSLPEPTQRGEAIRSVEF